AARGEKIRRLIVIVRWPGWIGIIAFGDEYDHSLARPRQCNAIGVSQIKPSFLLVDPLPGGSTTAVAAPTALLIAQVGIPAHTSPVKLESLNIEFGCDFLEIEGRTHIITIIQKPGRRIDLSLDLEAFRP